MVQIKASDFGITPGQDITKKIAEMLIHAKQTAGEKTLLFDRGTYYLDSEKCQKHMLYITNTAGDKEYQKDETPHLNAVPFYLNSLSDLTIDGGNSIFLIDGKATNIAIENCKNITIKNMELRHRHPDMHDLEVVGKSLFHVDFKIDPDSLYEVINGKLYFYGKDYRVSADTHALNAGWIGLIRKNTPNKLQRVNHPLFGMVKLKPIGDRTVRVYYLNTFRFQTGDCFSLFDVRRQFVGIFINRSQNIVLEHIRQRFNYSLALVAQDSETLTVDQVAFAPEEGAARKLASVADFIQVCMCRGKVTIRNSFFNGSGDDCLNVHGIHFKITEKQGQTLTVRFMHPQSHGFNPLRVGDAIAFIQPETLLETGRALIQASELLNEQEIRLTLDSAKQAEIGGVIEDIDACCDVDFVGNTLTRIITRGVLATTRGKVNLAGNHFVSTSMSGVLLSDDAKLWYESGMCRNVTIKDNLFEYCGQTPILIKPENRQHDGPVHQNIRITGNIFQHYKGVCIYAKSTDSLFICANRFRPGKYLKTKNCSNVHLEEFHD